MDGLNPLLAVGTGCQPPGKCVQGLTPVHAFQSGIVTAVVGKEGNRKQEAVEAGQVFGCNPLPKIKKCVFDVSWGAQL